MMRAPGDDELDLDKIRQRLRKMSDAELKRHGRAGAYMASPAASYGPVAQHSWYSSKRHGRNGGGVIQLLSANRVSRRAHAQR
jgi:hypothetical protein